MPWGLKIEWAFGGGGGGVSSAFQSQDIGVGAEGGSWPRGWSKLETPPELTVGGCLEEMMCCREVGTCCETAGQGVS